MGKLRHKQTKDERPSFPGFLKEGREGLSFLLMGLYWALLLSILRVRPREEGSHFGCGISNLGIVDKLFQLPEVSISESL